MIRSLCFLPCVLTCILPGPAPAQDWLTHRGDNARSGAVATTLPMPLREAWSWRAPAPPRPAWPGPARRDAYNKVENLKSRLGFDRAFDVVVSGDAVLFGSSGDDQVRCLDAASGSERWTFFTEAPVRFSPTIDGQRVLFGSDDGFIYCVSLRNGTLRWRQRPGPADRRVPGNGRMISVWPVRSGVVVEGGIAYCTAGIFPHEKTFLAAYRAHDGRRLWRHELGNSHPQGYLLASPRNLYVPTGRGQPVVHDRRTGERLRALGGAGGTFCLLDGDSVIYGPGKTGQLGEFANAGQDHVATFAGSHMIVAGGMAWMHDDHELRALRRADHLKLDAERRELQQRAKDKSLTSATLEKVGRRLQEIGTALDECVAWRRPSPLPLSMIAAGTGRAGGVIVTGGLDAVTAIDAGSGEELWRAPTDGRVFALAAARGRLYASTDRGTIHCFTAGERR